VSRSLLVACKGYCAGDTYGTASAVGPRALARVDHVVASSDGSRAFAVEGALTDPAHRRVGVDLAQAIRTPVEDADRALARGAGREVAASGRAGEPIRAADDTERVVGSPALA